jgi:hypothetical protein
MFTYQDARNEKQAINATLFAKQDDAAAKQTIIDGILKAYPQIGVQMRKGKHIYYVNFPQYAESNHPQNLI